jgi:hypothetical protein
MPAVSRSGEAANSSVPKLGEPRLYSYEAMDRCPPFLHCERGAEGV